MKRLLHHWTLYGLSILLLGAGLTLFNIAEAGALTYSAGSCNVTTTGALPTTVDSMSLQPYTVACSGLTPPTGVFQVDFFYGTSSTHYVRGVLGNNTTQQITGPSWSCNWNPSTNIMTPTPCGGVTGANPGGIMALAGADYYTGAAGAWPVGGATLAAGRLIFAYVNSTSPNGQNSLIMTGLGSSIAGSTILPVSGTSGQCTPTSESGFYSANGDGSTSFAYTYTYTGAVELIVGDPLDGSTPPITLHAMTFSNNTAIDSSPGGGTSTIRVVPATGHDPNLTHFYCYDAGQWYDWGTPSSGGSGTPPSGTGCSIISASGSGGNNGTAWSIIVQLAGSGNTGTLALDAVDGSTPTITVHSKTFAANSDYVNRPASTETLTVTQASGTSTIPELWCYSLTTSAWIDEGAIGTQASSGILGGGCFDLAHALSTSGMTLTNPISWVTGMATDVGAVGQWLIVPCPAAWHRVVNQFGFSGAGGTSGTCSATQPGGVTGSVSEWLGAGFTLIINGPSCSFGTMQSEEASGQTSSYLSTGDTFTSGGHTYTVSLPAAISAADANTSFSPFLTILLAILTAVIGVGFFFAIKALLQRLMGDRQ